MLKQAEGSFALALEDIWDENVDDEGRVHRVSGGAALSDRPKLLAAIEEVERGRAGVIVAERFDRLFRGLDVQREVIRRVEAAGGRLVTAAGKISHATAEAELQANLNGAIAEYTKRTAKERSWAAVEIAIEQGRVPWKDTTPGYDTVDGRLVPNEKEPVVAEAFAMRARGETVDAIRRYLREHGVERSYHGVTALLKSRVVLGELHFGIHRPNLQAHDPIVDRDLWQAVQRVRAPRGRRAKSDRLLARLGVLRCASCGSRMVVGTAHHGRWPLYRCPPTGDCKQRVTISADIAETIVINAVKAVLADADGRASAAQSARDAAADLERAQTELDAALRAFVAAGLDDEPAAVERLAGLRRARDAARERVGILGAGAEAALVVNAADDWDRLSLDERRALIRATVAQVIVRPGRGAGRVTVELLGQ